MKEIDYQKKICRLLKKNNFSVIKFTDLFNQGIPDLFVKTNEKVFWIEIKKAYLVKNNTKLRIKPAQIYFKKKFHNNNCKVLLCVCYDNGYTLTYIDNIQLQKEKMPYNFLINELNDY